ncbi:ATP-grasp domain-containing protein, partial [Fangia hongkongensis]
VIDEYVYKNKLNPVACLPFSDKGVPLGAYYAKHIGLKGDGVTSSFACVNKIAFRKLEQEKAAPLWYRKPFFKSLYSYGDALEVLQNAEFPIFLKPACEGNSRGCMKVENFEQFLENQDFFSHYFSEGIIAEQCIEDCDEYSVDGVNGVYVVTEKKTSKGKYRVEIQHTIPAPIDADVYNKLIEAGRYVAATTGSNGGAIHHEFFLRESTGEVFCVEPNRRPAGMKLWDFANESFGRLNYWNQWLDWAYGKNIEHEKGMLKREFYTSVRMLIGEKNGHIKCIDHHYIEQLNLSNSHIIDIEITKKVGDMVVNEPKDNSDFIGYIVCKSKTVSDLHMLLSCIEKKVSIAIVIE